MELTDTTTIKSFPNNSSITESTLKGKPELVNILPPSDGMIFGSDGAQYLTSIEQNAIIKTHAGINANWYVQSSDLKCLTHFQMYTMVIYMLSPLKTILKIQLSHTLFLK